MKPHNIQRVLVFSTDDHLYPAGGAEQAFGHIAKRLPNIEFDLICARLRKGVTKYERVGNVHIHRLGFGIPKVDGFVLALCGHFYALKLTKQHEYDFIWSIMASYGAFSAVRVKQKTGLPFLLTLQEGDSFEYIYKKVRFVRHLFDNIFKEADGVQAISRYLFTWARDMGFTGALGRVIPNGVALEVFTQTLPQSAIEAKRKSFGFNDDALILFTSSRLERKNGIGDVIAALPKLDPNVCFVVCGSGSLEEGLKQQVAELGLSERIAFMGFVDPSELPLLMRASDIFIRPSLTEGLGNAFLEAMASRMLVIGTDVGGIPDFLEDGKTGFVVSPEDPSSIVSVLQQIKMLDEAQKEAIIERAHQMVLERYNWDIIAKDMRTLFSELTDKNV